MPRAKDRVFFFPSFTPLPTAGCTKKKIPRKKKFHPESFLSQFILFLYTVVIAQQQPAFREQTTASFPHATPTAGCISRRHPPATLPHSSSCVSICTFVPEKQVN
jgi:hypothetical protein